MSICIIPSTGNVFADLGMPNPEECLAKADIAIQINAIIEKRGLTRTEAARLLKISQSSMSKLAVGKLRDFSVEQLQTLYSVLLS